MPTLDSLDRIKIPRSNTAAMLLALLYAQSGHTAWTGGEVQTTHLGRFVTKLNGTLHIARAAHQRTYYKKRGEASVHLVALPADGYVRWVLMSTRGRMGLLDRSIALPGPVHDLRAHGQHLRWKDYELFRMQKRFHLGGHDTATDETWSWRILPAVVDAHEAMIVERAKRHDKHGLLMHLETLRSAPQFAGVRMQVGRLHREANKLWRKCGGGQSLFEMPVRLPIMTKLPIYATPAHTVMSVLRDYTSQSDLRMPRESDL